MSDDDGDGTWSHVQYFSEGEIMITNLQSMVGTIKRT